MQSFVYISLQGNSFDPNDFHARCSGAVEGAVRRRRHSGAPLTNVPLEYWVTAELKSAHESIADALSRLLVPLIPAVRGYPRRSGLEITAHVVLEFDPGEDPVGLHFPAQVLDQMSSIGAALDIDAVPRVP